MFGPEYFTVGGYLIDGGVLCRECGEKRDLPARDAVSVAELENSFSDDGLYCDTCTNEIVEPYNEEAN